MKTANTSTMTIPTMRLETEHLKTDFFIESEGAEELLVGGFAKVARGMRRSQDLYDALNKYWHSKSYIKMGILYAGHGYTVIQLRNSRLNYLIGHIEITSK